MKKEHSSRWRKLDNAAQAFPAATGKKDTRVFRFYCQLKEDIQADLLQKALEQTMEHYPVFSMVLRKGLFWFYLEQRDLPAKVEEEKRPPCSEIYVPDHKTLLFQVSYYKTRINFEVFHALTDGTGAMLFLKELVSNYLILCHPEEIFSKVSEDMLTETDFEEDSFSQYYTGKKNEKEKSRPAYWTQHCWGVTCVNDMEAMLSYQPITIGDKEQALADLARCYEKMMMRSHTNGGYVNLLDECWKMCEKFHTNIVIMYDHVSCKNVGGLHGLFEDQARERGIHLIWIPHDVMDPRTVSRREMREAFSQYMVTVLNEKPLDPTLLDYEDTLSW